MPLPLPALRVTILDDGRLKAGGDAPALTLKAGPGALIALARGEDEFLRAIEISGNARLAQEIASLARHLRWDVEEELSRVFGDVAAHRIAEAARAFGRWQLDAVGRLAETFAAYAADEKRVLLRRAELGRHAAGVAELRDAIERLAVRVGRL